MEKVKVRSYQDLEVWKKAITMVTKVYQFTEHLPLNEKYGLQSQIRNAAISIPSNIAEGHARESYKEFLHFISIAIGSLAELETQFIVSVNLGLLNKQKLSTLQEDLIVIGKMLRGLQRSLKQKYLVLTPKPQAPSP